MKKILFLASIFALFGALTLKAQVTVGKLTPPDSSAVLQVLSPDSTRGVLVPEMTVDKRNLIKNPADGLMIYNITEDCFNYWNAAIGAWQSLCGGPAKADFKLNCDSIFVGGLYTQGVGLNGDNTLTVYANIAKPGTYTITGTTANGYGFNTTGTFTNAGYQEVIIQGQGMPSAATPSPGDLLTVTTSTGQKCNNLHVYPIMLPTATYSLSCGSAQFSGAYMKNTPLTSTGANPNKVTFMVNVSSITTGATWAVTSNTVNGISFSGAGTFATTGSQSITLQGYGTPTGTDPITLTFTTNSKDGTATCTATVKIAIPPMTVYALGYGNNFNYSLFEGTTPLNGPTNGTNFVNEKQNFGTLPNSTVQFGDGNTTWKVLSPLPGVYSDNAAGTTGLLNALNAANPPDIVVIGYEYGTGQSTQAVSALVNYVKKKGVLLMYCEEGPFATAIIDGVFGTSVTSTITDDAAGARFQFATINDDPLINGPFGNVGGQYWGEDASSTYSIKMTDANFASQIIPYSTFSHITNDADPSNGNVTMFRAKNYNFFWVGDGGFNSSDYPRSTIYSPFYVSPTAPYIPMVKNVNFGGGGSNQVAGPGPVSNAIFTANTLAWALQQALTNGINPH